MKKLKGATLYVVRLGKCAKTHEYEPRTSFPCQDCLKTIREAGLKKCVLVDENHQVNICSLNDIPKHVSHGWSRLERLVKATQGLPQVPEGWEPPTTDKWKEEL